MGITLTDVLLFGKAQSDDVDNATLVIYHRNILRWSALGGYLDIIVHGISPISLPDAVANSLEYLKAFGGTEQRNLPDGYIERQFIYMMDGSYLLTDIVPTYDGRVEMDFQTTSTVSQAATYLSSSTALRFAHITAKTFRVNAWGDTYDSTTPVANDTRYKFIYDNLVATLKTGDTTIFTNTFTDTGTTTTPLTINGFLSGGSINQSVEGIYLYSFKVWNAQGELIMDLVPAVQRGTVPVVGFYDTVSKTFKTATAGTFAAGGEAVPTPDAPMDIVCNNGVLKAKHQSGLPLGYTLLDYIESSGTQYIDTGKNFASNIKIYMETMYLSPLSFYGWGRNAGSQEILWQYDKFYFGGGYSSTSEKVIDTKYAYDLDFTAGAMVAKINGAVVRETINTYNTGAADRIYLFALNNRGTNIDMYYGRVYGFKYINGSTLEQNLVPAKRISDNTVGMYDTVSGQFFTNAGTGTFVAGTPISDPVTIYTDGTVETINVHGKNLFDISTSILGGLSSTDGSEIVSTARARTDFVGINTSRITVSIDANDNYGIVNSYYYDENKNYIGNVGPIESSSATRNETFAVPNGSRYVRVTFCVYASPATNINPDTFKQSKIQIESGSTATTYEPYFDGGTATAEMLLKVGDYQDVQSILDGAITRKVGVKVFDGTEDWSMGSALPTFTLLVQESQGSLAAIPCTNFRGYSGGWSNMPDNSVMLHGTRLGFRCDSIISLEAWKQYLADQYNAGTPVIIVYPLATPTTESVAGQTMQVQAGDNIVEITQASLDNLELEAKYQAAVSLTIQEVQDANLDPNVQVTIN